RTRLPDAYETRLFRRMHACIPQGGRAHGCPQSCSTCDSSIGDRSRGLCGHPMTAIDFAAFVDQLASVSGETIRPFFRTAVGVDDKGPSGRFDPVTAADR